MSNISVWGVDHGVEIAKADASNLRTGEKFGSGGLGFIYGGVKAKKGRKLNTMGRMAGRGIAEGTAGSVGAGAVAALATRGKNPHAVQAASNIGAQVGGVHGNIAAYSNAKRRGAIGR